MAVQADPDPWPRISVVIPALNEARNLPHLFGRLPPRLHEVILVDGYSEDDTIAVARALRPGVRIIRQVRRGKGNALACGFAAATGDIIAMVDADGSADPGEIPEFVRALLNGADFAKGTRFGHEKAGSADLTRLRKLGNKALGSLVNIVYSTHYSDLCYGYNAFWREILPFLGLTPAPAADSTKDGMLWGDGFEIETLMNIRVAIAGLVVTEVPSFEHQRIHGASNLNVLGDGLRVLRAIFSEYARSRRRPPTDSARAARPAPGRAAAVRAAAGLPQTRPASEPVGEEIRR